MKFKVAFFFGFIFNFCSSQTEAPFTRRVFYSILETNTVNPDCVLILHLGNNNLRQFPQEILKFKNLIELSFYDENSYEMFINTPWLLTEAEKDKPRKMAQKYDEYNNDIDGVFSKPRRNKVKKFPNEITQLKHLTYIILSSRTKKKEVKHLQNLLPNCIIHVKR